MVLRAFIQARMSSKRFPGKVLAPFRGGTVLSSVIARTAQAVGLPSLVVATSTESSDDPLVWVARALGAEVFRGPLEDVFGRFQGCLKAYPCDRFYRVSADSPLIDPDILRALLPLAADGVDIVTNVFPRTFPKGQSAELLSAATFSRLDGSVLTPGQREHVTTLFYENPARFQIVNLESDHPQRGESLAVDSFEDLARLGAAYPADRPLPSWAPRSRSAA